MRPGYLIRHFRNIWLFVCDFTGQMVTDGYMNEWFLTRYLLPQVGFDDVIAEPSSSHSFDKVWIGSHAVFELVKYGFYLILTTILAVPMAFILGIVFGVFSCVHIWYEHHMLSCCFGAKGQCFLCLICCLNVLSHWWQRGWYTACQFAQLSWYIDINISYLVHIIGRVKLWISLKCFNLILVIIW
jgi:hypothetical protein